MRKKSLVDYFQSQVMIYIKYLTIQREKNMNKVIAKEIKRVRQRKGNQVIEKNQQIWGLQQIKQFKELLRNVHNLL